MLFARVGTSCSRPSGGSRKARASGANNAIRELGGVFGVAVLASIFAHYGGYTSGTAHSSTGWHATVYVGAAVVALGSVAAFAITPRRRAMRWRPSHPSQSRTRVAAAATATAITASATSETRREATWATPPTSGGPSGARRSRSSSRSRPRRRRRGGPPAPNTIGAFSEIPAPASARPSSRRPDRCRRPRATPPDGREAGRGRRAARGRRSRVACPKKRPAAIAAGEHTRAEAADRPARRAVGARGSALQLSIPPSTMKAAAPTSTDGDERRARSEGHAGWRPLRYGCDRLRGRERQRSATAEGSPRRGSARGPPPRCARTRSDRADEEPPSRGRVQAASGVSAGRGFDPRRVRVDADVESAGPARTRRSARMRCGQRGGESGQRRHGGEGRRSGTRRRARRSGRRRAADQEHRRDRADADEEQRQAERTLRGARRMLHARQAPPPMRPRRARASRTPPGWVRDGCEPAGGGVLSDSGPVLAAPGLHGRRGSPGQFGCGRGSSGEGASQARRRRPRRPRVRPPVLLGVEEGGDAVAFGPGGRDLFGRDPPLRDSLLEQVRVLPLPTAGARNPDVELEILRLVAVAGSPKGLLEVDVPAVELALAAEPENPDRIAPRRGVAASRCRCPATTSCRAMDAARSCRASVPAER